ncbi:MAG: RNA polymerase sigma factor [Planctomycetota bacterium]
MEQPNAEPDLTPDELRLLAQRDPSALGRFFDVWFSRIYSFVRRMVADDHLAEDLTQDVFVHIYRAIESYDPARDIRPWVFTIATNKVRDYWRSRRHRDSLQETSADQEGAADFMPSKAEQPDTPLHREERDEDVRKAIDELPEGMRLALVLRVYEELSFEEIGRILDRNEVAARKRYSRALEALRGSLAATHRLHAEGS